ncbi:uncharacterized protein LOC105783755 isoform X2 [Gossypium raimondii]|uniref:uncharacterized protein LOC105783755 isoform X2 n=1 Tax=Gossypium raimondii TaxID=29730 RepID=UPI00063A97F6|nr:uncharacterized protein LOC105783755 isoform X2 [Gossypium raimondii]
MLHQLFKQRENPKIKFIFHITETAIRVIHIVLHSKKTNPNFFFFFRNLSKTRTIRSAEILVKKKKKKDRGNMKDDEEFEMLLDEIPHATSHHHHHHHLQKKHDDNNIHHHVNGSFHGMYGLMYDGTSSHYHKHTCVSPVSGFSLHSDGSSSSLFSNDGQQSLSENGSPTPPALEDLKPHLPNALLMDSAVRNKGGSEGGLIGELGLCRNRSKMYISNDQEKVDPSFRDFVGIQPTVPMSVPLSFNGGFNMAFSNDALGSHQGMSCLNGAMRSPWQKGDSVLNLSTSLSKLSVNDALVHGSPRLIQATPRVSVENLLHHGLPSPSNGMVRAHSNARIPHEGLEAFATEDSFIIQGKGLNYMINKGLDCCSREQNKGSLQEVDANKRQERRSLSSQLDGWSHIAAVCGNVTNAKLYSHFSLPPKCSSLAEARGYVYLIAKDQHGCRFLQRVFDEGSQLDVQIIFKEIIDHVVELMMNPFGNYLMQKLLEVCNEEQRMQILLMVTEEPGQLVRISLNTHGTRVVQKLIETLKTRQQISLVISALEPGFLSLIKDLNGNHVVQRCLQCLSSEDNKFIFVAAAKYCVDIATHQHGCCVLQRCISHSTGEYRDKLVEEISTNGLLLAQDAYGNYVVQFILELKIPSATSTLVSQFQGNYVHLSSQKFSSHVVEKCLVVLNDESRSRIIRELLSATHFERLLQDPHANYVVQTALRVSEGPLHNSLIEAIESRKAISRNSPYSKRIFSQKLLKK